MRYITAQGLALIQHFEGFAAMPYTCPAGYLTVGYGHVVKAHEDFSRGISQREAQRLLQADVQVAEQAVLRLISVPLADGQFDALVSYTFNLGAGALQRSTLRRKVNGGYHHEVPQELMRWVFAGGRKLPGLVRRRTSEGELYWLGMSSRTSWQ